MNNEQKFFSDLAGLINPGWDLQIQSDHAGGGGLRALNTYVYVIDVATGWSAAGGLGDLSADQARLVARQSTKAVLELSAELRGISEAAGLFINSCGEAGPGSSAEQIQTAIVLAFAALTETKTFAVALERNVKVGSPELAGHWIYMAYKKKNGITVRPVWVGEGHFPGVASGRFMAPSVLDAFVRVVVEGDTTNASSSIGAALRQGGGAIVAERWRP